jgi:hypothetical protein
MCCIMFAIRLDCNPLQGITEPSPTCCSVSSASSMPLLLRNHHHHHTAQRSRTAFASAGMFPAHLLLSVKCLLDASLLGNHC